MDYNFETSDPNKITNNETDTVRSSNLVYTSLLRACEEADANYFDVQSTAVAAKDDLSLLWNDQTQTHSKLMDTNLDDIEMNDELLDKLVTAILQDNTLDLHLNNEASNQLAQSTLSCNHETQEPNSIVGVSDNTLQVWQKLFEGDNSTIELSQMKSNTNPSVNPRSVSQTPRQLVSRISENIFHRRLTRSRSQLITASTPHKALQRSDFEVSLPIPSSPSPVAENEQVSSANSHNQGSYFAKSNPTEPPLTSCSGPITRSRSASKASQSSSRRVTITPNSSTRYYLRARSSASSQSNANFSSSQSRNIRTHKDSHLTPSHQYQTRSRTSSNKTKVKAPDKCCTKLAVVVRRVRMSLIARLRCKRSSIWLPSPQKKLQPRRLATPKTRLEPEKLPTRERLRPRRLARRKAKILSRRKSLRHASSVQNR